MPVVGSPKMGCSNLWRLSKRFQLDNCNARRARLIPCNNNLRSHLPILLLPRGLKWICPLGYWWQIGALTSAQKRVESRYGGYRQTFWRGIKMVGSWRGLAEGQVNWYPPPHSSRFYLDLDLFNSLFHSWSHHLHLCISSIFWFVRTGSMNRYDLSMRVAFRFLTFAYCSLVSVIVSVEYGYCCSKQRSERVGDLALATTNIPYNSSWTTLPVAPLKPIPPRSSNANL